MAWGVFNVRRAAVIAWFTKYDFTCDFAAATLLVKQKKNKKKRNGSCVVYLRTCEIVDKIAPRESGYIYTAARRCDAHSDRIGPWIENQTRALLTTSNRIPCNQLLFEVFLSPFDYFLGSSRQSTSITFRSNQIIHNPRNFALFLSNGSPCLYKSPRNPRTVSLTGG